MKLYLVVISFSFFTNVLAQSENVNYNTTINVSTLVDANVEEIEVDNQPHNYTSPPVAYLNNCVFTDSVPKAKTKLNFFKDAPTFNKGRFIAVGASTLVSLASSYIYLNNAWWKDSKTTFHFDGGDRLIDIFNLGRDATYAKELDKFGHFFGGRLAGESFGQMVKWSGKSEKQSLIWGGVFGSALEVFIEVKDGFSPNWGFSIYDCMAGSLGSFYPYFQSKSRFLNALDYKFSYYRKDDYYFNNVRYDSDFQDDYMNHTYWFTFNPKRYKPESKWPKWLGVSVGFGVDNTLNNYHIGTAPDYADMGKGGYEFYIAPDIDFRGLLPQRPGWQRVAKVLNLIKFPTPAMRFSRDTKFLPIHF